MVFFESLHIVALSALVLNREGILSLVVAGSTGFTCIHVAHGSFQCPGFEGEYPGVAIWTLVVLQMKLVTERSLPGTRFEFYFTGYQPFVAFAAITVYRESILAVMAEAAGAPLFHLRHGHAFIFCYNLAVMTAPAGSTGLGNML